MSAGAPLGSRAAHAEGRRSGCRLVSGKDICLLQAVALFLMRNMHVELALRFYVEMEAAKGRLVASWLEALSISTTFGLILPEQAQLSDGLIQAGCFRKWRLRPAPAEVTACSIDSGRFAAAGKSFDYTFLVTMRATSTKTASCSATEPRALPR